MSFFKALERYAFLRKKPLPPDWALEIRSNPLIETNEAGFVLERSLGWETPGRIDGYPRPDQFPVLCFEPKSGWFVGTQWAAEDQFHVDGEPHPKKFNDAQTFWSMEIPDPLSSERDSAAKIFWNAIKRKKYVIVVAGLATVFANLLTLVVSFYAMQLYDRVIPLGAYETLFVLTVGVAIALGLDLILRSLRALMLDLEAQNIDREISEYFFARVQAVRLDSRPASVGTFASQIQSQEQIRQVFSSSSVFVLADLPFAFLFLFVIGMIGGSVVLIPLLSLPIGVSLALLLATVIKKSAVRAQATSNEKNGHIVDMLEASETLKANRGGWFVLSKWNQLIRQIHSYEYPVKKASAISTTLFSTLQQGTYVAVMCYGAYLASFGDLTTGALLACSILVGRINGPLVAQLPSLIVQWGYARSALTMLDNILSLPVEPNVAKGALRVGKLTGNFDLNQVSFNYRGQKTAIEITNLRIRNGERVAVIGGVGAGKTTLLKLLSRIYQPSDGSITLDGFNLNNLSDESVRASIGYLPQSPRLIRGTLRDNLTLGLANIEEEEILDLAKRTNLYEIIRLYDYGLETLVHEGGGGLSVGQKGLISLNRIIHGNPDIMILDEPTSALDQDTSRTVLECLKQHQGQKGTLIVATHKTSILSYFTRVLVMKDGRIIGDGKPEQVLSSLMKKDITNRNITTKLLKGRSP